MSYKDHFLWTALHQWLDGAKRWCTVSLETSLETCLTLGTPLQRKRTVEGMHCNWRTKDKQAERGATLDILESRIKCQLVATLANILVWGLSETCRDLIYVHNVHTHSQKAHAQELAVVTMHNYRESITKHSQPRMSSCQKGEEGLSGQSCLTTRADTPCPSVVWQGLKLEKRG